MTSEEQTNQNKDLLFSKFQVIECLKKDTYSSVYIANHIYLGKKILLKTLNTKNLPEQTGLNRFKREAKILAKLDHPNIIKILDFGSSKEQFYISFEYFDSTDLRTFINEAPLNEQQKRDILIQIARGLAAAHQASIVHRDIKPENILINKNKQVKIADFGLAISIDENLLTRKSTIVGTPAYMSPEQIRGEPLTTHSDLFSLGIVCFELFFGYNPFMGKDLNTTINNILKFDPSSLASKLNSLPTDTRSIITNLLQPYRQNRFQSAEEIIRKFDIEVTQSKKLEGKFRLPKRIFYILASLFILMIIMTIYILKENKRQNSQTFTQGEEIGEKIPIETKMTNEDLVSTEQPVIESKETFITNKKSTETPRPSVPGKLFITVSPQANLYIDSEKVSVSSTNEYISLLPGEHNIEIEHAAYPRYQEIITIASTQEIHWQIQLDTLFGYLHCQIYPWGNVFLNGKPYGQTPFFKPLILTPGRYLINIQNPDYSDIIDSIAIARKETTFYRIDLEQSTLERQFESN